MSTTLTRNAQRERVRSAVQAWGRATVATLFYSTVLFYSYRDIVSPVFANEGLTYRDPQQGRYAVAVVLCIAVAVNLPHRIVRPSHFALWVMFVTVSAPGILIAQYMRALTPEEATKYAFAVAGTMILIRVMASPRPSIRRHHLPQIPESTLWLLLIAIALMVYVLLFATVGVSLQFLSFDDVYDVRADYKVSVNSIPIIGYLLPAVYNVINPALMAKGVYSGRKPWFLAGAVGQVVIYLATGQKAVLLSSVAIVGIAWLFRHDPRLRGTRLLTAVASLSFVAVALDAVFHTVFWNTLIIRRFIIFPGAIGIAYVAVFLERPKGNFGPEPPYPYGPSYLVGNFLTGNPFNNANIGLFGHGFYNFGYLGIFIEGAIVAVCLLAADAACRGLPTPVASIVLFQPFIAVASASIFTTLLSHSFLPGLAVCALLPRTGWGRPQRPTSTPTGNGTGPRGTTTPPRPGPSPRPRD